MCSDCEETLERERERDLLKLPCVREVLLECASENGEREREERFFSVGGSGSYVEMVAEVFDLYNEAGSGVTVTHGRRQWVLTWQRKLKKTRVA